ncbi:OLC1v1015994C1 [Oldenlandia corymbosa var. corymbosa]|uniref:OLC1v1015994C1 n=1 Tax=Oldenlandia corymbosa var. corymbosa TaxID=529605 RepID=A0AAV1E6E9_OLDCO|nr:OLC1v1015994C1 [Oldenlandia corymbosa var. corymbosa]
MASINNKEDESILRPLADFPASLWENCFDNYTLDQKEYDLYAEEIEALKEEVRSMLIGGRKRETIEKLNLIDAVEQLGISYHFENEIDALLEEIFHQNDEDFEALLQNGLSAAALHFRLLRQHGFNISSGTFKRFLNENGEFKETLGEDIKGLLSLYEAAEVRTHEDNILEEALSFAITHLNANLMPDDSSSTIAKQVNHALKQSLHKGLPRVEARHYISVYEEDENHNPLLLRVARLDYRLLQMLYRQELAYLTSWVNDLGIVEKVPYSRNRVVENYFSGNGVFFEPQYTFGRIVIAKTLTILTIIDDTYDAYGTIEELTAFRDAVERWDIKEIDGLPEYMEPTYMALLNLSEWVEKELTKRGRSYAFSKYKEECKQYVRASYNQSCWFFTRELPPFPVYKVSALITSTYFLLQTISFLAMESGTIDVFDWQTKDPKILVASAKIARFINDVASHEMGSEGRAAKDSSNGLIWVSGGGRQWWVDLGFEQGRRRAAAEDRWWFGVF